MGWGGPALNNYRGLNPNDPRGSVARRGFATHYTAARHELNSPPSNTRKIQSQERYTALLVPLKTSSHLSCVARLCASLRRLYCHGEFLQASTDTHLTLATQERTWLVERLRAGLSSAARPGARRGGARPPAMDLRRHNNDSETMTDTDKGSSTPTLRNRPASTAGQGRGRGKAVT